MQCKARIMRAFLLTCRLRPAGLETPPTTKPANWRTSMEPIDRRTILATGALALAGAAARSEPAAAQAGPKPMFPVAAITIPIVGETDVFQVRRIYCIGRNYAAHSREMGSDPTR